MRVKVISDMTTARGIIPAGRIIEIPAGLLAKLAGKVEAVDLLASPMAEDPQPVKLALVPPKGGQVSAPATVHQKVAGVTPPPAAGITKAGIAYSATVPRCYNCKSSDLWQSIHGITACRRCHPPMVGAEAQGATTL